MLKRVSIQNFKSLKDVTLDLQKVNLLIGPNNSGKTNFLKALEYVASKYQSLPNQWDKDLTFDRGGATMLFSFVDDSDDPVRIEKRYDTHQRDQKSTVSNSNTTFSGNGIVPHIEGQHELEYLLRNIIIYKPDPNQFLTPGPVGYDIETVNANASNLINFLDFMIIKYRRTIFSRIEGDLEKCIPEFDEIKLENVGASDSLIKSYGNGKSFRRIGLANNKQSKTYWADELSEGTLYFLALLCIINQPNPPKLLLLEEPEKGIHPRRIREVMEFVRRLVAEKHIQVIMTTHSPLLLDEFAENTEGVFVFDKEPDGATIVRNLQRDVIEPANRERESKGLPPVPYTEALGEYWTIGFLGGIPHETN